MKKKLMVVMLPTENETSIVKNLTDNSISYGKDISKEFIRHGEQGQHLYFISNDEIKEGDYIFIVGKIRKASAINCNLQSFKKAIATTDKSLNLPLIPESFVRKYVEEQGNIKEVMINLYFKDKVTNDLGWDIEVRQDNTVIVSKVKDTYTRDEVIEKCNKFLSDNTESPHFNKEKWFEENL